MFLPKKGGTFPGGFGKALQKKGECPILSPRKFGAPTKFGKPKKGVPSQKIGASGRPKKKNPFFKKRGKRSFFPRAPPLLLEGGGGDPNNPPGGGGRHPPLPRGEMI